MKIVDLDCDARVVEVISRDNLEGITSALVDGAEVDLGIVKSFSNSETLKRVLEDASQVFVSWVRLDAGQVLETHTHPIDSMYIMCEGTAQLEGALNQELTAGDVVMIPKGQLHGFVGGAPDGYWALSVQFEMSGIYDAPDKPLVNFLAEDATDTEKVVSAAALMQKNEELGKVFEKNPIFPVMFELHNASDETKRKFLSYFQILSDHFQRMMLIRSALCDHEGMSRVFWEHLDEEFGHHENLKKARGSSTVAWDPIYDATNVWFTHQMMTGDDRERLFLVNYVVEESASIFYKKIDKVFAGMGIEHFGDHAEWDEAHSALGKNYFDQVDYYSLERLARLQKRGWSMVECQYRRLAEIAQMCMNASK